ncbi:MAG: helix-turn-helix domain-containing protein [Pseudomonadota bacterium]
MDVAEAFGRAVKARRAELGITQEELADKGELARSFVSGMERGEKAPTVNTVWKLTKALDCKPSELWLTVERLMESQPKKRR